MDNENVNNIFVTIQTSLNSDGLFYPSISIYYSGCDKKHKCKMCHNPELQDRYNGFKTTTNELINDIEKSLIGWFSVYETMSICYIGGEPLAEWNKESVYEVSKYFKNKYNKTICNIVYTWRYLEDLNYELNNKLKFMDYGVFGDFKLENSDINFIPSSKNQYIYDFNKKTKISNIKKG